jgi:Family of unknown function (DUF5372)
MLLPFLSSPWHGSRTTPHAEDSKKYFRVTHPFHPWYGQRFEFVDCRRCWGEWRVFYYTENGQMAYFPSAWTDAGQADPFVVLSRGRAVVRFEDLLRLVKLIEDLKQRIVKEIRPNV